MPPALDKAPGSGSFFQLKKHLACRRRAASAAAASTFGFARPTERLIFHRILAVLRRHLQSRAVVFLDERSAVRRYRIAHRGKFLDELRFPRERRIKPIDNRLDRSNLILVFSRIVILDILQIRENNLSL
jgi:hypothetical protein